MDEHDGVTHESEALALTREEAERRLQDLVNRGGGDREARRTRAMLLVALIVVLLLLCGVGAFLYRLLVPTGTAGLGGLEGSPDTGGVIWVRSIYGIGPGADQLFVNPNDVATGPDGTIWVTDPTYSRIAGFRSDGTFTGRIVQGSQNTGEPFRLPARLAVGADGIMYIADIANERLTIMDGSKKLTSAKIPGLTSVDVSNDSVVVGSTSGFAVLDKDGNVKTIVGTRGPGDSQFDVIGGIAIDSNTSTIFIADTYNNRLSAWDFAGRRKWMVKTGNPANAVKLQGGGSIVTTSSAAARLQLPVDVTLDGKGRPMVLDGFGFSISAFDPKDGRFIDSWGAWGEKDGQFIYPTSLSYDASKDWFLVADTSNRRAEIIRIPGTGPGGAADILSGLNRLLAGPLRALWPCLTLLPLLLLALLLNRRRKRRREREAAAARTGAGEPAVDEA